ncbi:MAG: prepilin-type N-terminal cleavage/methylation domain-containing protein [Verrucomicrobia subdivision 3 bacterium]|nr:prepilin-type N-terminal cleavage/methylation domain-containing protein [Limisphaerales bacterium]
MISDRTIDRRHEGFTLIEIMVVCAIIGIIITISVPAIYRVLHPESMTKAVKDIIELCEDARSRAVLENTTVTMVLHTAEKRLELVAGATPRTSVPDRLESLSVSGEEWRMPESPAPASGKAFSSVKLSDRIMIEGIRLHLRDFTDDEVVSVNFYPNGTSDEFSLFLVNDQNEARQIYLEVVTGTADYEVDRLKFR